MMGPALLDLYSTSYGNATARKKKPEPGESSSTDPSSSSGRQSLLDPNADQNSLTGHPPTKQRSLPNPFSVVPSGGLFRKSSPREASTKSLPGLRNFLFPDANRDLDQRIIGNVGSGGIGGSGDLLLVNIREEDELRSETPTTGKDSTTSGEPQSATSPSKYAAEFQKSSSDGCKMRNLLTAGNGSILASSNSMQHLRGSNNNMNVSNNLSAQSAAMMGNAQLLSRCPVWYVGELPLEPLQTMAMLPWMVADFRRQTRWPRNWSDETGSGSLSSSLSFGSVSSLASSAGGQHYRLGGERRPMLLELTDRWVRGIDRKLSSDHHTNGQTESWSPWSGSCSDYGSFGGGVHGNNGGGGEQLFLHPLLSISKVQLLPSGEEDEQAPPVCFVYLLKQPNTKRMFSVHVFETEDQHFVSQLIDALLDAHKRMPRQTSVPPSALGGGRTSAISTGLEDILANSQQYEVMYVGKQRLKQKRVSASYIDQVVCDLQTTTSNLVTKESTDVPTSSASSSSASPPPPSSSTNTKPLISLSSEISTDKIIDDDLEENEQTKQEKKEDKSGLELLKSPSVDRLSLPNSGSLITNSQSLDEALRLSIMRDLREVQQAERAAVAASARDEHGQSLQTTVHSGSRMASNGAAIAGAKIRLRSVSGDLPRMSKQCSLPCYGQLAGARTGVGSGSNAELLRRFGSSLPIRTPNRTMLLLIGRLELCLLSPDSGQMLLCKTFSHVSHCAQGQKRPDHFGFICREQSNVASVRLADRLPVNKTTATDSAISSKVGQQDEPKLEDEAEEEEVGEEVARKEESEEQTDSIVKADQSKKDQEARTRSDSTVGQENAAYVLYLFRCENQRLVNEIMQSLKQAFNSAHHAYQQSRLSGTSGVGSGANGTSGSSGQAGLVLCDRCPMQLFHRLCVQLQPLPVEAAQRAILEHVDALPAVDRSQVMNGYAGVQVNSIREQNERFMALLRRLYSSKQALHNHYPSAGGLGSRSLSGSYAPSTLDTLKAKAKKSLSSSFETILKLTQSDNSSEQSLETQTLSSPADSNDLNDLQPTGRPRSSTFSSIRDSNSGRVNSLSGVSSTGDEESPEAQRVYSRINSFTVPAPQPVQPKTPLFSIFLRVGSQQRVGSSDSLGASEEMLNTTGLNSQVSAGAMSNNANEMNRSGQGNGMSESGVGNNGSNIGTVATLENVSSGNGAGNVANSAGNRSSSQSWRRSIFSNIQSSSKQLSLTGRRSPSLKGMRKKSPSQLRQLWKKAIQQQILLNKMEKENQTLRENQYEMDGRKVKLTIAF